jgi:hypothetical protein
MVIVVNIVFFTYSRLLTALLLDLYFTDAGLHIVMIDLVNESQYKDTGLHLLQNISHSPTMHLSSFASA